MKIVYVDLDRCFGCRQCEWICALQGSNGLNLENACIRVHVDPAEMTVSTATCLQCETPFCMEQCPVQALQCDPSTGAIVIDGDLCIGCRMCITACPFENIHFDNDSQMAVKCDLCGGDPLCVTFCMAKALNFGELKEVVENRQTQTDRKFSVRAVACTKGGAL